MTGPPHEPGKLLINKGSDSVAIKWESQLNQLTIPLHEVALEGLKPKEISSLYPALQNLLKPIFEQKMAGR